MEDEVLQKVIFEMLDDLKEVRRQQAEIMKMLADIKEKITTTDSPLTATKTETSPVQIEKITAVINTRFDAIRQVIESQPRPVIKQFRILFFPEYGATEYFKTVGKIALWLLALIISTYLYVIGKQLITSYSNAKEIELATFRYKAAWYNLYYASKKSVRQKMDSVWRRIR